MTATSLARRPHMPTIVAASLPGWAVATAERGEPNSAFDAEAAARRLTTEQRAQLPSVIAKAGRAMEPASPEQLAAIEKPLDMIGARVAPGTSERAATAWVAGLIASLAHLPGDILANGVAAAVRRQFTYLNEVGPFVAAEMEEPLSRRRAVLNRLRHIELVARSLPQPVEIATPEQIDAVKREVLDRFPSSRSAAA